MTEQQGSIAIGGTREPPSLLFVLLVVAAILVPVAAVLPWLGVAIAWPFLFLVPGWILIARAVPALSAPGRLGTAVVASIYVSAHLVDLLATITGGLNSAVVLTVVLLLNLGTTALLLVDLPWLAPPPEISVESAVASLRTDRAAWLVALLAGGVVAGVLAVSIWHETDAGWVSGGWNWSDFLVHVSIGQSLMHGNFPPQVPYFAGAALTYHWFGDFHAAIASLASGVGLIPIDVVTNGLMGGALALLVWELALRITGDRRVAALAGVLAVFGGGMGWIRLPMDMAAGRGDLLTLIANNPYDNTWAEGWPFFTIASVFGTGLLTHRATALGLPGFVAVVLLVHASLGRRPAGMAIAGLLAALLAPFDFFAFPATYLVVLLLFLARRGWREPTWRRDAVLFLAPVVLSAPFVVGPALQQQARGAAHLVIGWASAPLDDGPLAVLFFYLTNLGVPFLLAAVAIVRRRLPERGFLVAWVMALFLVPNVLVVSVVTFDMNKYFQMLWIAVAILGGVADPEVAGAAHHCGHCGVGPLAGPRRRLVRVQQLHGIDACPGAGRGMDRREHAGSIGLRHGCLDQQPGRPCGAPPGHVLRPLRRQPGVRPRSARSRCAPRVLRWRRRRGGDHGAVRRDVRALHRRFARLRGQGADGVRGKPAVHHGVRRGWGHRVAPGPGRLTSGARHVNAARAARVTSTGPAPASARRERPRVPAPRPAAATGPAGPPRSRRQRARPRRSSRASRSRRTARPTPGS